jgi:hypothetical protein
MQNLSCGILLSSLHNNLTTWYETHVHRECSYLWSEAVVSFLSPCHRDVHWSAHHLFQQSIPLQQRNPQWYLYSDNKVGLFRAFHVTLPLHLQNQALGKRNQLAHFTNSYLTLLVHPTYTSRCFSICGNVMLSFALSTPPWRSFSLGRKRDLLPVQTLSYETTNV